MKKLFLVITAILSLNSYCDDVFSVYPKSNVDLEVVLSELVDAGRLEDQSDRSIYTYSTNYKLQTGLLSNNGSARSLYRGKYNNVKMEGGLLSRSYDRVNKEITFRENESFSRLDIHFGVIEYKSQGKSRGQYAVRLSLLKDDRGNTYAVNDAERWFDYNYLSEGQRNNLLKVNNIEILRDVIVIAFDDLAFGERREAKLVIRLNDTLDMKLYHKLRDGIVGPESDSDGFTLMAEYLGGSK